jgi:hypothetical protein
MADDIIDLADCDRKLTESETSDVIHRAGFPRSAISARYGDAVLGIVTGWASDLADARCGVPTDLPPGPHPHRGTLRWYRHYIARLDLCADMLADDWRATPDTRCGPYPWCETAFGSVSYNGRSAPPPNYAGRDPELPCVSGYWPFDMPSAAS